MDASLCWPVLSGWPTSGTTFSAPTVKPVHQMSCTSGTDDRPLPTNTTKRCTAASRESCPLAKERRERRPGVDVLAGFLWGSEPDPSNPGIFPGWQAETGGPQCTFPAESAFLDRPPLRGRRHRRQPVAVRQPGHPAELRRLSSCCSAARRAAAQHRTDRTAGMMRTIKHTRQVRCVRRRDGGADRLPVPVVQQSTAAARPSAITRRCSPTRPGSRPATPCASPESGSAPSRVALSPDNSLVEVRRRPRPSS